MIKRTFLALLKGLSSIGKTKTVELAVECTELGFQRERVLVLPVKVTIPKKVLDDIRRQLIETKNWDGYDNLSIALPKG